MTSLIQTASQNLKTSNRRILVTGPRSNGKTTFAVSASAHAGPTIVGDKRECPDVLVIQGDCEGVMGAVYAGLHPGSVLDMTECDSWESYQRRLVGGLKECNTPLTDGTIKIIVLDLALPAELIVSHVNPATISDWQGVRTEGSKLFRAFLRYQGVTVIGICQVTSSMVLGEGTSKGAQDTAAVHNATALSIGGERSTYKEDLVKGVATPWLDHASFIFARETKRKKDATGESKKKFYTLTQSTLKYAAKSRAENVLPAVIDGERSLRSILEQVYGDNI